MVSDNQLLVIIDPREDSGCVIQRAIELAQNLDVGLELFACHHQASNLSAAVLKTEILHQTFFDPLTKLHESLEKIAEPVRAYGLEVSVDAVCDAPLYAAIIRKVLRDEPRWVIKDARHHRTLAGIAFDNTDWNLIRECPCPLWLVRSPEAIAGARIIAAVDPLHEHDKPASLDQQIVALAQFISAQVKGELHILHAYDTTPAYMITPGVESGSVDWQQIEEHLYKIHDSALFKLAKEFSIPASQVHLEAGSVRKTMSRLVKDLQAGLVVMGAVARNPLKRIFIGSSAEEVLDNLPCDIVVVKPDWFVTSLDKTPYVKDLELIKDRKWGLKC